MYLHFRCVALLGLLSWPCATTAQSFQNASSTQPTLTLGGTGTPVPSRTLNSSSSQGMSVCMGIVDSC